MEDNLINIWEDADENSRELYNDALLNTGPPIIKITDIKHQIPYEEKKSSKFRKSLLHIGQRKLFLNELQFLNKYVKFVNSTEQRQHFVIYAGGSPGHHMYELSRYYPNVTFIIIDPSRHQSYISDNLTVVDCKKTFYKRVIYYNVNNEYIHDLEDISTLGKLLSSQIRLFIIRDYCTPELLIRIKNELPIDCNIYLWSDIRTDNAEAGKFGKSENKNRTYLNKNKDENKGYVVSVTDGDILWNLAMQYNWLKVLEPDVSMFKFRLPFYVNDIDWLNAFMKKDIIKNDFEETPELNILENYVDKMILYPKGTIYIQPWQPKSSTESRLVIKKKNIYTLIKYDAFKYDGIFNYYNVIERVIRKHNNGVQYYKYGYCECNDCAIELTIFKDYLSVIENNDYIKNEFKMPKYYDLTKTIGNMGVRLMYLLGTHLEIPTVHGMNRL
jgi:hypothetical protein